MSKHRTMSLALAIDIMAHWSTRQAYEEWAEREDLWAEEFPDFGVEVVQMIVERMEGFLPRDISLELYEAAHKTLADRATGAIE